MPRKLLVAALAVSIAATLYFALPAIQEARFVRSLVDRNLEARGGAEAWENVSAMRMSGMMDLGQLMVVPYVLEQKRPGKMCLEFEFDGAMSTQCTDGTTGWKVAPFRGRSEAMPMTEVELREAADSSDPFGLLYDYRARGVSISSQGTVRIDGRDAHKLQIDLPRGGVRWLYLDVETALEVKLETPRVLAGRELMVETIYAEWQEIEGLLVPARQETRTIGDDEAHFLTIDSVVVNPRIDDDRFHAPMALSAAPANTGGNAS